VNAEGGLESFVWWVFKLETNKRKLKIKFKGKSKTVNMGHNRPSKGKAKLLLLLHYLTAQFFRRRKQSVYFSSFNFCQASTTSFFPPNIHMLTA